ncbi:olfactory receptor 10A3-like [Engystomops pustulosus]|uniref:olfactory receptor 10A3-like n=1 Tax=Engystomops pustulosus TaxID=76066 RepID=UPI003AFA1229
MENQSAVSEVFLVGFPGLPEDMHSLVSTVMFLVYIFSLTANGSVICLVTLNASLHQPMYLLIANLTTSGLLFDTVTLPKLIARYWFGSSSINFKVCLFQMFLVHSLGSLDSFLLMEMAIDRYVAISQPLRYSLIITNKRLVVICVMTWIVLGPSTNPFVAMQTSEVVLYCPSSPKNINTLFCTQTTVTALACRDATYPRKLAFVGAMVVLLVPLGIILISYFLILLEIFTSSRSENLQKAFYTCATHLLVVTLYYMPRIFTYIVTNIPSIIIIKPDINALLLFSFSNVPHMANPIIYFLRTKEIRQTLAKSLQRIKYRVCHMSIC